jgi:hypothetical protein
VGRNQEGGRAVQLLHRGPADSAPLLAVAHHRLLPVRDDDCFLDQPGTLGMADPRSRLGRHFPARGRRWEPYTLPDRAQSVVDDLLVLIAPKQTKTGSRFPGLFMYRYIFSILTNECRDVLYRGLYVHLEFFAFFSLGNFSSFC